MRNPDDQPPTTFHRPCIDPNCDGWVHRNSKKCGTCDKPSPWSEEGKLMMSGKYVVTENFASTIGIQFTTFTEGQMIEDASMIAHLLSEKAPIRPFEKDHRVHRCPHCGKSSLIDAQPSEEEQLDASGFPRVTLPYSLQ